MNYVEDNIKTIQKYHTELLFKKFSNTYILSGFFSFKTKIKNEIVQDTYKIEMKFGDNFHEKLPSVREIGCRIERNIENHINSDGSCCLGIPHEIKISLGKNFSLLEFFDQIVTGYFAQYSYKEKYGYWPYGESQHYAKGLIEYYMETYKLKSYSNLLDFLEQLASLKNRPKGYNRCNCGCNKLIKNCKYQKLIKKAYIKGHDYSSEFNSIKSYLEGNDVSNKN